MNKADQILLNEVNSAKQEERNILLADLLEIGPQSREFLVYLRDKDSQ